MRRTEPGDIERSTYKRTASALWRWVDAPQDAVVAAFVDEFTRVADPAAVRAGLTDTSTATLMTYARRCVLRALRTRDPAVALAAFDALSAVGWTRVDPRDLMVAASLASHAARRTGLDSRLVLDGAAARAEPQVGRMLGQAATSAAGSGGYDELRTPDGPVLVSGSVKGATAILRTALAVAAVIEDDGRYEVATVSVERELPAVWLDDDPPARRRLRRCVSVMAEPPDTNRHFLLAFVLDAASEEDAATVAAAVRADSDGTVHLGVAEGRRCAIVIARPVEYGAAGIEDSLDRFAAPLTAAMR